MSESNGECFVCEWVHDEQERLLSDLAEITDEYEDAFITGNISKRQRGHVRLMKKSDALRALEELRSDHRRLAHGERPENDDVLL